MNWNQVATVGGAVSIVSTHMWHTEKTLDGCSQVCRRHSAAQSQCHYMVVYCSIFQFCRGHCERVIHNTIGICFLLSAVRKYIPQGNSTVFRTRCEHSSSRTVCDVEYCLIMRPQHCQRSRSLGPAKYSYPAEQAYNTATYPRLIHRKMITRASAPSKVEFRTLQLTTQSMGSKPQLDHIEVNSTKAL